MSNLLALLSQASSSLSAYRTAAGVAGNNLQNADTPGYARQRAILGALPADRIGNAWLGRGVGLLGIQQARDRFVEVQIPGALGAQSRASTESSALQAVRVFDPELQGGLGDALAAFSTGLRKLAGAPGDPVIKAQAAGAAGDLARAFNRTAASVQDARRALDARLTGQVESINQAASQLAELNKQIRSASVAGAPNDLLDARQRLQDQLATEAGATPVTDADGNVQMFLADGTALVSGGMAGRLVVEPDPGNAGLLAVKLQKPGGGVATGMEFGGSLGGTLAARDGALRTSLDQLDALAWDLAGAMNAAHRGGFASGGSAGGDLIDVGTSAQGAASRMSLLVDADGLAIAAGSAGSGSDGGNLQVLIDAAEGSLAGGPDAVTRWGRISADFGTATSRASTAAKHEGALLENLQALRESASGVSIDEELIELNRAQRAFEAVGKVITATDEMLDTLMKLR